MLAIPQHLDLVCKRKHFWHAVRYVHESCARFLESCHKREKTIRFCWCQHRSRLIENKDSAPARNGARNNNELLRCQIKLANRAVGVYSQSEFIKKTDGALHHCSMRWKEPISGFNPSENVLSHGAIQQQREFLRNDGHAMFGQHRIRTVRRDLTVEEGNAPSTRRLKACKNLEERRLSSAILTKKCSHFSDGQFRLSPRIVIAGDPGCCVPIAESDPPRGESLAISLLPSLQPDFPS